MRTTEVELNEEMYDKICEVLTKYEDEWNNDTYAKYIISDMYEILVDIANLIESKLY